VKAYEDDLKFVLSKLTDLLVSKGMTWAPKLEKFLLNYWVFDHLKDLSLDAGLLVGLPAGGIVTAMLEALDDALHEVVTFFIPVWLPYVNFVVSPTGKVTGFAAAQDHRPGLGCGRDRTSGR
jgi:hypothetical protein